MASDYEVSIGPDASAIAKAFDEVDDGTLLSRLDHDSHLKSILQELEEGIDYVYASRANRRLKAVRKRGAPMSESPVELLLVHYEYYDTLLSKHGPGNDIQTCYIGRAILRMILGLDYTVFGCREVELSTVHACKIYLSFWVRQRHSQGKIWDSLANLVSELDGVRNNDSILNRYEKTRGLRRQKFGNQNPVAWRDFQEPSKKRKCRSTSSSDSSASENNDENVKVPLSANKSKYRKLEILRKEVGDLSQSTQELEEKQQNINQGIAQARTSLTMEENELHRLHDELEKAKARYEEAKNIPEIKHAEFLKRDTEMRKMKDLLAVKQDMLQDYEGGKEETDDLGYQS